MDGGAWKAAVRGVAKSQTRLRDFTFTFHFHALEKEMATHSSVLAWRIPETGEPGGLPSMGSHQVGHDWSDLAAAAAFNKDIYRICEKKNTNHQNSTTPPKFNYNTCKELNGYFTKEETCKAQYMKRFSTSLAIWEIQIKIKIPMGYYYTLIQFSLVAQSCPTLRPHGLQHTRPPCPSPTPEITQTHVHWVSDAIQPLHPLSSPSPPAFNLSQHQILFWVSS